MIYLVLSVLASSTIFVIFKLFDRYKVNTFQAIVMNYITACASGLIAFNRPVTLEQVFSSTWLYGALFLGILFIVVFNVMAITTQRSGLSVVSVASKMSVTIPVVFGIAVYHESTGWMKVLGIVLALVAVYMASIKSKSGISIAKKNLIYPLLVFLGSGIIDTSLKYLETNYVPADETSLFSSGIFAVAALIGLSVILIQYLKDKKTVSAKSILAGFILGVPNYFSIYFLIKALKAPGFESSTVFTVNNVSIVMVSTALGIILFKERLILKNWIGIGLAIISIILVAYASL